MDILTHGLVPYALAMVALGAWRASSDPRRWRLAIAFGVAGASPDIDGMFDWASRLDGLYWLQHRGVSHTLVGAPFFGLAAVGGLAWLGSRFPKRLGAFAWVGGWRGSLLAAVVGSWTHLVLDGVTYAGVPLLWPFAPGRVSLQLFHWLVWWMFLLGVAALLLPLVPRLRARGRATVMAAGLALAVLLVVLGAFRAAVKPDAPEGTIVYPRSSSSEWTILEPHGNGSWRATLVRSGNVEEETWFHPSTPPDGEAQAALDRARDTNDHRGFQMGSFGPQILQVTPVEGGWNVTFVDVAQRFEGMNDPRWTPSPEEPWGMLSIHVTDRLRTDAAGW